MINGNYILKITNEILNSINKKYHINPVETCSRKRKLGSLDINSGDNSGGKIRF